MTTIYFPYWECNCVLPPQSCRACRHQARLVYGDIFPPPPASFGDEDDPDARYDDWGRWIEDDYDLPLDRSA